MVRGMESDEKEEMRRGGEGWREKLEKAGDRDRQMQMYMLNDRKQVNEQQKNRRTGFDDIERRGEREER